MASNSETTLQPNLVPKGASAPLKRKSKADFGPEFWKAFLSHGWLLALDSERLLVGWGRWSKGEDAAQALALNEAELYLPDFYLESAPSIRQTLHWDLVTRAEFAEALGTPQIETPLTWQEPDFEEFKSSWTSLQEGFKTRGLKKGVPVVFARTTTTTDAAFRGRVLARLAALPRVLFPYGFWNEDEGLLGATPEVLFAQNTDRFETMALAGTRAKTSALDAGALLSDPKERYEHQLVVDDLHERLSELGEVSIGETGVLELPTLLHLKTKLLARPRKKYSFSDLVRWLHPTPALGLSPRSLGFSEMRRWDRSSRARFGAPFGVRWPEGEFAVVAIRNIQWRGSALQLGSGCGVVPESQIEREWAELALKRNSVKRMLGL